MDVVDRRGGMEATRKTNATKNNHTGARPANGLNSVHGGEMGVDKKPNRPIYQALTAVRNDWDGRWDRDWDSLWDTSISHNHL